MPSTIQDVIRETDEQVHSTYPIGGGLHAVSYAGGWLRAMETPGGDVLVGVACTDAEMAARLIRLILAEVRERGT